MQDSTVSAYALATGQEKSYAEMTQAEKVAIRYAYVMDATKNSQGDFANTSDGTANSLRTMQESVKELGASFGKELLPVITPIIRDITDMVKEFGDLDTQTKKNIIGALGLAAVVGPLLVVGGSLTTIVGGAAVAIGTLSSAVAVMTTGAAAATPAIGAMAGALTFLTGPVGLVIGAVALLAVGIVAITANTKDNTEEQKKAIQISKDYLKSNEDLTNSVTKSLDAQKDSLLLTEQNAVASEILATKIFDLSEKENKSVAEKDALNAMLAEFNTLMPDINLAIDTETGALNNNRDAIREVIAEIEKKIRLEAVAAMLTENAKKSVEVAQAMTASTQEVTKAKEKYVATQKAINDGIMTEGEKTEALRLAKILYGDQLAGIKGSYDGLKTKQDELTAAGDLYNSWLTDDTAMKTYITNAGTMAIGTGAAVTTVDEEWDALHTKTMPKVSESGRLTGAGFNAGLLSTLPGILTTAQLMRDAVNTPIAPMPAELTKKGAEASFGLGDGILSGTPWTLINAQNLHDGVKNNVNPLEQLGTNTGVNTVTNMGAGIDVSKYLTDAAAQGVYDGTTSKLNPLGQFGLDTGGSLNSGLNKGMTNYGAISAAIGGDGIGGVVGWIMSAFRTGFDMHSPARKMEPLGVNVVKGLFVGMNALDLGSFADSMIRKMLDSFQKGSVSAMSLFKSMGENGGALLKRMGINLPTFGSLVGGMFPASSQDITSSFGYRESPGGIGSKYHEGVDIGGSIGDAVWSTIDGYITQAGWAGGYGNMVTVDNGSGIETIYAHLSKIMGYVGDYVNAGTKIGEVGSTGNSTGPHLHYGVYENGVAVDPMTSNLGGSAGGDVASWIRQAMAAEGVGMENFSHLMEIAMNESGGNPGAINNWDSNAMAGTPSKGLMQTIQSTFDAYNPGGNIWNPIDNARAAIRYMIDRYGSIANTGTHGYAMGTLNASPGVHWVGENGPELMSFAGGEKVYTNQQSTNIINNAMAKQPVTVQLVLQNGTKLAEYMIDDINNMLGNKTGLAGRGMA